MLDPIFAVRPKGGLIHRVGPRPKQPSANWQMGAGRLVGWIFPAWAKSASRLSPCGSISSDAKEPNHEVPQSQGELAPPYLKQTSPGLSVNILSSSRTSPPRKLERGCRALLCQESHTHPCLITGCHSKSERKVMIRQGNIGQQVPM